MKIIVAGKLPQEKEYKHKCSNCGCQFTFKLKEAEKVYDQRDGNSYKITCPQVGCNRENWISPNSLEEYIQDSANYYDR